MQITVKKLSDLHKPDRNVRKHTDKQLTEYVRSLEMFDQIRPIVVDESGEIIAGNGLYDALVRMGKETCDCYVLSGLSAAQKKKLMLADNRVYELGITDSDVFDAILKDLGGDFDIPGWDPDLIEMITASMADTDDMVKGYGVYEGEEVDRISSKTVEDHSPAQGAAPSYAPSTQQEERPADSHAEPVITPEEPRTETGRFVICPHCGERICL